MLNEKMTALYSRVAHADHDAIVRQEIKVRNFVYDKGFTNIFAYTDNGESGLDFNRPALSRLEADVEAGRVCVVVVQNYDRIGRDFIKTEKWIANARRKGVSFISMSDDGSSNRLFADLSQIIHEYVKAHKITSKK